MSFKSWVLGRVQGVHGLVGRGDLPARDTEFEPGLESLHETAPRAGQGRGAPVPIAAPLPSGAEHLGAYAALVGAIRDELEHFVASQVRLHLAIAERDRFLLTAVGVRCQGAAQAQQLLEQFLHEFKPEQVRRYLAREVIAGLPNAAAIDLSQFAGMFDANTRDDAEEAAQGGEYRELLAALRSTPVSTSLRPYQVSVVGRWAERLDPARPAAAQANADATPSTPLTGPRCEFDVEDGDGRRRVVLQAVAPGRRYVIGTGEACDFRVNGSYASRRHAEIWLDGDAWWVTDAGSTNGIRVESPAGQFDHTGPTTAAAGAFDKPTRIAEGARIVLSARTQGPASEYPWLAIRPQASPPTGITPIAAAGSPKTPLTAILPTRTARSVLRMIALQGSGERALELRPESLPVSVGRSRNQTLVVGRCHEGVSGHHLDIVAIDESWAEVVVHGDNGVIVDGAPYPAGSRFRWKVGESMMLGSSVLDEPPCTLSLARPGAD